MSDVIPIKFDLSVQVNDTEHLRDLVNNIASNGTHSFEWEYGYADFKDVYTLTIHSCWSNNLVEIAKLLPDYKEAE